MKALVPLAHSHRSHDSQGLLKALVPLAHSHRSHDSQGLLKALVPLAVAARHILLRFAQSDRGRADD